MDILKQVSNIGIVPVIAIDDASKAVPLAKALAAGGLPAAEVTFRTARRRSRCCARPPYRRGPSGRRFSRCS